MVAYYGMSEKVGNISFFDGSGQRDMFTKPFSERTAEVIDEEVRRIVDEAVATARDIIVAERQNIERLADLLLEKETIFTEDIQSILGKSPQQDENDALEATAAVVETEGDDGEDATAEVTYIVDSPKSVDNEKTE
jgi:cell division protease FtsH